MIRALGPTTYTSIRRLYPFVLGEAVDAPESYEELLNKIVVADPDDSNWYMFDWADSIPTGEALDTVTYTIPASLTNLAEVVDVVQKKSYVRISGIKHAEIYQIEADATTNGATAMVGKGLIRGFN